MPSTPRWCPEVETFPSSQSFLQQRDVFARVKARRGEREERDDCANVREAPPVARSRRVTDCEAGEGKEQAVGEHVAVLSRVRDYADLPSEPALEAVIHR